VGRPLWWEVGSVSCILDITHRPDIYEVEVNFWPTVSRPVCLGVRRQSGTCDQFFYPLEIYFRQLRICNVVPPSLTRVRVCNLLVRLLLDLSRAVTLRSKSSRTHGHILLSHLSLPQPGGPGPRIYIPQKQGGPVIPPGTGFLFLASYNSQGCSGGILTPSTRVCLLFKTQLNTLGLSVPHRKHYVTTTSTTG
jgi:hypothetical protein